MTMNNRPVVDDPRLQRALYGYSAGKIISSGANNLCAHRAPPA
jgi:hypothetical protein